MEGKYLINAETVLQEYDRQTHSSSLTRSPQSRERGSEVNTPVSRPFAIPKRVLYRHHQRALRRTRASEHALALDIEGEPSSFPRALRSSWHCKGECLISKTSPASNTALPKHVFALAPGSAATAATTAAGTNDTFNLRSHEFCSFMYEYVHVLIVMKAGVDQARQLSRWGIVPGSPENATSP